MSESQVSIEHARFGRLCVPESAVLYFGGMPGFPRADRFALMQGESGSVFLWLVSLDVPELAFAVMDPHLPFPGYAPQLGPEHLGAIGAGKTSEVDVLAIAKVRADGTSLNLAAPLLVNLAEHRGAQVILDDPRFGTSHEIPTAPAGAPEERPAP